MTTLEAKLTALVAEHVRRVGRNAGEVSLARAAAGLALDEAEAIANELSVGAPEDSGPSIAMTIEALSAALRTGGG